MQRGPPLRGGCCMTCELIIWDPSRTFCGHPKGALQISTTDRRWDPASLVPRTQAVLIANTPTAEMAYFCILIPKFVSRGLCKKPALIEWNVKIPTKEGLSFVCICASLWKHINTLGSWQSESTLLSEACFHHPLWWAPPCLLYRDACSSSFPYSASQPLLSWCTFPVILNYVWNVSTSLPIFWCL